MSSNKSKSRILELIANGAAIVSLIAALSVFVFDVSGKFNLSGSASTSSTTIDENIEDLRIELANVQIELENVNNKIDTITQVPDGVQLSVQISELETSVADMQRRQTNIEEVILDNPAKALEMPLLRQDIDNLEISQRENLATIRQNITQVYDLNKWLLGAMAISIISFTFSNYFKEKEEKKKENSK